MSRTRTRKRIVAALLTTSLVFGGLELGLRLGGFSHPIVEFPIVVWNPDGDRALENDKGLHRAEVRQLWGPRPNALISANDDERINGAGWRGPIVPRQRRDGVARIATMGDSSVFGLSVRWEETFTAQLERLLEDEGQRVEVFDCGVIGSTTHMALWRYRELVRAYRPDVVVLGLGAINDHFAECASRT